jgi:hypothetical protein
MMRVTVRNPWNQELCEINCDEVTEERLQALAQHMDDEIREELHLKLAPCAPGQFWAAYVERVGADVAGEIWFS